MTKQKSRPTRWSEACETARRGLEELQALQEEYNDWLGNLPENLQASALGEKLQEIEGLDIDAGISVVDDAEGLELPQGFGRD